MTQQTALTIVGFGDSITLASRQPEDMKWLRLLGAMLAAKLPAREFRMINAGSGGNTSREGLLRIESDVIAHQPDCVLVQFGGNDATRDMARHVTLEEYDANLESIRLRIQEATPAQIVMLTFPPVVDDWHTYGRHELFRERGGLDAYIEQYRAHAGVRAPARPRLGGHRPRPARGRGQARRRDVRPAGRCAPDRGGQPGRRTDGV